MVLHSLHNTTQYTHSRAAVNKFSIARHTVGHYNRTRMAKAVRAYLNKGRKITTKGMVSIGGRPECHSHSLRGEEMSQRRAGLHTILTTLAHVTSLVTQAHAFHMGGIIESRIHAQGSHRTTDEGAEKQHNPPTGGERTKQRARRRVRACVVGPAGVSRRTKAGMNPEGNGNNVT